MGRRDSYDACLDGLIRPIGKANAPISLWNAATRPRQRAVTLNAGSELQSMGRPTGIWVVGGASAQADSINDAVQERSSESHEDQMV